MKTRKTVGAIALGLAVVTVGLTAAAAAPRQPMPLPTVGNTFTGTYDAVWDATLKSFGVVKIVAADKATGRIETEPYPFNYSIAPGLNGSTQVIWVSMRVTVARTADNQTSLQVEPLIHDSLVSGFTPGPTNNPWQDLFGRIRGNLGVRG